MPNAAPRLRSVAENGRASKPRPGRETVVIEFVTPALADAWLDVNVYNRDLRDTRVINHAGALLRGEWTLTGDAIVFDENDNLLNGQHRLSAIKLAGELAAEQGKVFKGIRVVVLRGVEAKAQEVMDQGLKRSVGDALKLRGETNYFVLAAALSYMHQLAYTTATGNVHYANSGERPTTPQQLAILDANPTIRDFRSKALPLNRALKMRTGVTVALYYTFAQLDAGEADAFFDSLLNGVGLEAGNPILALRRALVNEKLSSKGRMPHYREAALICKAWNYWREGRTIATLTWHFGGSQREPFPLPK